MDSSSQIERFVSAAEHFYAQFLARFSGIRDLKPQTVIACSARTAGAMLARALDDPHAQCAKLTDIMFVMLHVAGHAVVEQDLDKDAAIAVPELPETRQLLEQLVLSYCKSAELGLEDAAYALAVTTGLFVHNRSKMFDIRKGAAVAVHGFYEGCEADSAVPALTDG